MQIRARLPQVRREVRRPAAQGFQAPGRLRPLGRSVPDDERRSTRPSSPARSSISWISGYVYKGLKPVNWCIHDRTALAEAEVEYENHTSPSIWVRFALTSDPAAIDPALAGTQGLRPDLDHHAVDHSGQPGDRLSIRSSSTWRWKWRATSTSSPQDLLEGHGGEVRLDAIPRRSRAFPGAQLEGAVFRHPFLDAIRSASSPITSRWNRAPARSTPRPGHGQEDYVVGQQVRHRRRYCPVDAAGRFFHAEGAPGDFPTN